MCKYIKNVRNVRITDAKEKHFLLPTNSTIALNLRNKQCLFSIQIVNKVIQMYLAENFSKHNNDNKLLLHFISE